MRMLCKVSQIAPADFAKASQLTTRSTKHKVDMLKDKGKPEVGGNYFDKACRAAFFSSCLAFRCCFFCRNRSSFFVVLDAVEDAFAMVLGFSLRSQSC